MNTTTLPSATIVKSDELLRALKVCAMAKRPAFTWGSPGIGKSDVHEQLAAAIGARLIDIRASQWDSVDTRGVPYVERRTDDGMQTTRWAIPDVLPNAGRCVLFLDELNSAKESVQAALYQLVLDRRLGDYTLPDDCVVFAAGNLDSDRAVTNRMSTALANRFVHFQLAVDNDAWQRWALLNDLHVAVISFLRWKPELLHKWDAKSLERAQPTPRAWKFVSDLLVAMDKMGDTGAELALMTGTIGAAAGTEFTGFLSIYRKLPDPESILLAPDKAPILDDVAVNYALCGALAKRASPKNVDRLLQYAQRMADAANVGPES